MTPRTLQSAAHFSLAVGAVWAQVWSPAPAPVESGVVVYVADYGRDEPRGIAPGQHWDVAHVAADGGDIVIGWEPGCTPLWITWAEAPLEYATEPYPAAWWAGPGDWDVDGQVDIEDLLCRLDDWFAAGRPVEDLAVWVGIWLEGGR